MEANRLPLPANPTERHWVVLYRLLLDRGTAYPGKPGCFVSHLPPVETGEIADEPVGLVVAIRRLLTWADAAPLEPRAL